MLPAQPARRFRDKEVSQMWKIITNMVAALSREEKRKELMMKL